MEDTSVLICSGRAFLMVLPHYYCKAHVLLRPLLSCAYPSKIRCNRLVWQGGCSADLVGLVHLSGCTEKVCPLFLRLLNESTALPTFTTHRHNVRGLTTVPLDFCYDALFGRDRECEQEDRKAPIFGPANHTDGAVGRDECGDVQRRSPNGLPSEEQKGCQGATDM